MPHAILKYNDGVIFFVEYSGEDYDLTLEGIYLKDSTIDLQEYLDYEIYIAGFRAAQQDYAELQVLKDEYLREVQLEMRHYSD